MDAYRILGLQPGASEEDVKTAYRALAQKYQPEHYEAGPLRDDAQAKMDELNAAFDTIMGALRTGDVQSESTSADSTAGNTTAGGKYNDIRAMINGGDVENALSRLNGIAGGAEDAEWNFLVGSAYYYKGWLADALRYFDTACRLEPSNREYEAARRNLNSSANGNMNGNPYASSARQYNPAGAGCSCCDMCSAMMCMNMCCGCGNGGC
ncbi:MAG: DnaJ domain-containing protein [Ruthenibacterium sp.]